MATVEIDRRKQVIVDKEDITAFKNAIREDYRYNSVMRDKFINMIEFYIG